jgi:deazaflavin-dependent oxidoreductase (nitroreductase family)
MLDEEVRTALAITQDSTMTERTIDITTVGRKTGQERRIETCFYRVGDDIYLSGLPRPRPRDWLANLAANPQFEFHLKNGVVADLTATATVITEPAERRRVLTAIVDEFNARNPADRADAVTAEWVEQSPLALVTFEE